MSFFIISNRLAGTRVDASAAKPATIDLIEKIHPSVKGSFDIKFDTAGTGSTGRRCLYIDGEHNDIEELRKNFPPEVIVESVALRNIATISTEDFLGQSGLKIGSEDAGVGYSIHFTLLLGDKPVTGASVSVVLLNRRMPEKNTKVKTISDDDGIVKLGYDPSQWVPNLLVVTPKSGIWSIFSTFPQIGSKVEMLPLPKTGPIGWWHQMVGELNPEWQDRNLGEGIAIGVIDTGVGPHPYLESVIPIGSIINGKLTLGKKAARDAQDHGSHVSGIIAAQPVQGSGDFRGIAASAKVMVARVFPPEGGANQGDIAEAIDILAMEKNADLINMSLGSQTPSAIERDAIIAAAENGALCIAAAGNDMRQPVIYPAAYPETVAVSALGLLGAAPPSSTAAHSVPGNSAEIGPNGVFVANFLNTGAEMTCAAPGVGIISTVPARPEAPAPYASMSGTSMATPATTAALATLLSKDVEYRNLPRGLQRAQRAGAVLTSSLMPLGLPQVLAGLGLVRANPT